MLDVPQGVMTPARLSNIRPCCSECGSTDIEITLLLPIGATHGPA
jgi:hypothetical protein